jgi:hypothetical protein
VSSDHVVINQLAVDLRVPISGHHVSQDQAHGQTMAEPLPLPSETHLQTLHVGKSLDELPTPAAILDRAKASQNCSLLLSAVSLPP